jgi:hypothetical protein
MGGVGKPMDQQNGLPLALVLHRQGNPVARDSPHGGSVAATRRWVRPAVGSAVF